MIVAGLQNQINNITSGSGGDPNEPDIGNMQNQTIMFMFTKTYILFLITRVLRYTFVYIQKLKTPMHFAKFPT